MAIADSQLLETYIRNRDGEAFRQLVQRHIDFVYAAAVRQSNDRDAADDITQAVFVLMSQRAQSLACHPTIKGWLFNATRYVAANSRRAQTRRKQYEREAAAMRCEVIEHHQEPDITPHLDDALARLPERDRQVLLLRFFEDMPLAQVGGALGISESAAKKRLTRAIERIRQVLQRRGATVASESLATLLSASATQAAPAYLVLSTTNLVLGGASAAVGPSSVGSLAQGAGKMMFRHQMKLIAAKCVVIATCAGAAAAVVARHESAAGHPAVGGPAVAPVASQTSLPKMLANSPPDSQSSDQPADWEFDACRQVLRSVIDGYEHDDPAAVKKLMYFAPGSDPQAERVADVMVKSDVATYRLQKAAVAKFGTQATGLNLHMSTAVGLMIDVLARTRLEDARLADDVISLTPSKTMGRGGWPAPVYFRNVDGAWKLDCGKTFHFKFRVKPIKPAAGQTDEQTWKQGVNLFTDGLNAIAADTENGKIRDIVELQQRFYSFFNDEITSRYATLDMNIVPK